MKRWQKFVARDASNATDAAPVTFLRFQSLLRPGGWVEGAIFETEAGGEQFVPCAWLEHMEAVT